MTFEGYTIIGKEIYQLLIINFRDISNEFSNMYVYTYTHRVEQSYYFEEGKKQKKKKEKEKNDFFFLELA